MTADDKKIETEQLFINLLLNNKDLVGDWVNSGLKPHYFDNNHKFILFAIEEAFRKNSLLTREAYYSFAKSHVKNNVELNIQSFLYDKISILDGERDNFDLYREQITDRFISENAVNYVEEFRKEMEAKGSSVALKKFAKKITDLSTDSLATKIATVYESVSVYAPQFFNIVKEKRSGNIKTELITCGIKELDRTMVVGFAPGTLTLICADVSNFKCLPESEICPIGDGTYDSIKNIYNRVKSGEDVFIPSLDKNKKIYLQKVNNVFDNGIRECFRIKTKFGFKFTGTKNHPALCFTGYKNIEDLKIGEKIAIARKGFFGNKKVSNDLAFWLGCMIADGGTSQTGYKFANIDKEIIKRMKKSCVSLGGRMLRTGKNECDHRINGLRFIGKKYGLDGKLSINKNIHKDIFKWKKSNIVNFLQGLFSCDGTIGVKNNNIISYSTSSKQLAEDVRNILLKFDIISKIFTYTSSYNKKDGTKFEREAYRVIIYASSDVLKYIKNIGFCGEKQKKALKVLNGVKICSKKGKSNVDLIPNQIWSVIEDKFKKYKTTEYKCRVFLKGKGATRSNCPPIYNRKNSGITREKLKKIARFLNRDKELTDLSESDIFWDEIISIEAIGKERVYDISMPKDHNFVANNIITHNSTMMLNIGINIWKKGFNVLFVPLEMPRDKMYEKFLSNITGIPFEKIEHPTLLSEEEVKILADMTEKLQSPSEAQFFIMDTYERVPVSVIRREIEKHVDIFKPRVVIIDYTANLTGEANSEKRRSDEMIGDALKDLRTMGRPGAIHEEGFAIVTAAQIGRDALKRIRRTGSNKTAFFSEDIRGSHDYSADSDNIYAQMIDESQPNDRLMIFPLKCRYGKKSFGKNENRAVLEIRPEISVIRSIEDEWMNNNKEDIMKKIDDKSIDVKEEELSFEEDKKDNLDIRYEASEEFDYSVVGSDDDNILCVDDIAEVL